MSHGYTNKPKILATEAQENLPRLPVPDLEHTCRRYLAALKELQDPDEHEATKRAVDEFLRGDGPRIQARLKEWAMTQDRQVINTL
jgi:carnitine O-acetyltransferase